MNVIRLGGKIAKWAYKPRILKTGLAVFVTAALCQWLEWPAIFAVIAAIVSIEPSVRASLQKGKIRLPAAAVGAFFAMLFDAVLGQSPMTYALSAMLTIYVCHLLRWNDAVVVATLTAVNMIAVNDGNFVVNFFVRLGTTSIGIIVSVIVNFAILPPQFSIKIKQAARELALDCADVLHGVLGIYTESKEGISALRKRWDGLTSRFDQTFRLIDFQTEEYRYRRRRKQWIGLKKYRQKLEYLRELHFRIGVILSLYSSKHQMSEREKNAIEQVRITLLEQMQTLFDEDEVESELERGIDRVRDSLIKLSEALPQSDQEREWRLLDRLAYELWAIFELLKKIK